MLMDLLIDQLIASGLLLTIKVGKVPHITNLLTCPLWLRAAGFVIQLVPAKGKYK